jgi:hypothetical protein
MQVSSIRVAAGAVSTWYGIIGFTVAAIGLVNLVVGLFSLGPFSVLSEILQTYRSIVHKPIDWLLFWLPFKLPATFKDIIVLWTITGGAIAKAKDSFMGVRPGSLKRAVLALFLRRQHPAEVKRDQSSRFVLAYNNSPRWLRVALDVLVWPRFLLRIFRAPWASIGKTKNQTWYSVYHDKFIHRVSAEEPSFDVREREGYIHTIDLRVVFLTQLLAIVVAAIAVIGLSTTF